MNKDLSKRILTHVALWFGFLSFIVLIFFLQHGKVHLSLFERLAWGVLLFYVNYLILIPHLLFKEKRVLYFFVSLLVIFLLVAFPTIIKLLDEQKIVIHRLFRGRFFFFLFMQLFFFVAAIAIRFYEKWHENEKRAQKMKTDQVASELYYLKNQINPHFLFNSLNSIYALTVKHSEQAPEAVITLSELMRYMLYETDNNFVSVEKELQYIKNYIKLQRLRMTDSKDIVLEVKGDITNKYISPLLLISFIENAFKYGVNSAGKTRIWIVLEVSAHQIHFHCENSIGNTQKNSKTPKGIGLKNTKERLELLYPNKHSLNIKQTEDLYSVDLKLEL